MRSGGGEFYKLDDANGIPLNVIKSNAVSENETLSDPLTNNKSKKSGKIKNVDITEHLMSITELCETHHTNINLAKPNISLGIRPNDVFEKIAIYGINQLTPPKQKSVYIKFLDCLGNMFNVMLILAGILEYVLLGIDPVENFANSYIGAILIGVAFLNASIELYQIQKSASILSSFMNMIPSKASAIRGGHIRQLPAQDLVPGDIVFVRLGDKVPADICLFHSADLKVDNSSLTGESEPQERNSTNSNKNPLEATNLCFNGTLVVEGEAYGVVIRTGDSTVLGQIAKMTTNEHKKASPLSEEIERFCKLISIVAVFTAIFFFVYSLIVFKNLNNSLSFAIGILVAWVPQGLPATVTMLLSIAAQRMSKQQVLVKDLQGVETLGAITMLATDKTGTLTRNQMTVTNMWTNGTIYSNESKSIMSSGEVALSIDFSGVDEMILISCTCSRARFDRTDVPIDQRKIIGDATESGLLRFAASKYQHIDHVSEMFPKVFEIPFNSDTKTHMSIIKKSHKTGSLVLLMKGAPERILKLCSTILLDHERQELNESHKEMFLKSYEYMAGKGHRVLAFAQLELNEVEFPHNMVFQKNPINYPTNGLCFVGLTSLEDPPKHGVREAIGKCRQAGIKVVMVTGDHPLTAEAIARKINLMTGETKESLAKKTGRDVKEILEYEVNGVVIHGEKISELSDDDWDLIFDKDEIIFARTSPKNKLEIVKRAQAIGHIVGVTGDGVNDSPALKKADLGIAMNQSGSDVSKEAAAMILLDDNFSSTIRGITEGRLIFINLKKSIQYAVTHIMAEVIPYLLYALIPIPLAITAIQVLVIDLGFELLAALSFAWEPAECEDTLMRLRPRKPVTFESTRAIKKKQIERQNAGMEMHPNFQSENDKEFELPSKWKRYMYEISRMRKSSFWKELITSSEGEILVDAQVLCWSYLEAGLIECIGSLVTFFLVLDYWGIDFVTAAAAQSAGGYFGPHSPDLIISDGSALSGQVQFEALRQAQSGYYLSILVIQIWNLFACKSRLALPFGRHMLANTMTWYSIGLGVLFGASIVYLPFLNGIFLTSYKLHPGFLIVPFLFGFGLFMYSALRRYVLLRYFPTKQNLNHEGLMMHPTLWSIDNMEA